MRIHARTVLERETPPPERAPSVLLYHFGAVADDNPTMPPEAVPIACRERQCSLRLTPDPDSLAIDVEHEGGNGVAGLNISTQQMNDPHSDVWADIRRWIDGLHEGEGTA